MAALFERYANAQIRRKFLKINSIARNECERCEIVPKCCNLLIIDVADFTSIARTLHTRIR